MSPTTLTIALILTVLALAFALAEWLARRGRARDDDPSLSG